MKVNYIDHGMFNVFLVQLLRKHNALGPRLSVGGRQRSSRRAPMAPGMPGAASASY